MKRGKQLDFALIYTIDEGLAHNYSTNSASYTLYPLQTVGST